MDQLVRSVVSQTAVVAALFAAPPAPPAQQENQQHAAMLDSANDKDSSNTEFVFTEEMRQDAVSIVHEWAEAELDEGEGYGDRLYALCVGTATDDDADLTDEQSEYVAAVAELVGDYLQETGVPEADVDALLDGEVIFGNEPAARVHDVLLDKLPQGDDAMVDAAGKFVVGDDDTMLDATYRKVVAIRGGKKVRIKKRVGGTVRLTAGQKAAVRKMQMKAFSGQAKMKRAKSMRIRRRMLGK